MRRGEEGRKGAGDLYKVIDDHPIFLGTRQKWVRVFIQLPFYSGFVSRHKPLHV